MGPCLPKRPAPNGAIRRSGGLVIDPANRGVGNGRKLLEAAEQWAESNNLAVIRVRSNVVRPKARSFYKRRGYEIEKMSYTFTKRLDDL